MSFSLGFGPIPWLLMGELLPSRARGPCAAFATGSKKTTFNWTLTKITTLSLHFRTNWASTFVVTKTFLWLQSTVGAAAVFWLYALLCAAALIFVILAVPETRGRWQILFKKIQGVFWHFQSALSCCTYHFKDLKI